MKSWRVLEEDVRVFSCFTVWEEIKLLFILALLFIHDVHASSFAPTTISYPPPRHPSSFTPPRLKAHTSFPHPIPPPPPPPCRHDGGGGSLPGVFLNYELSPMRVRIEEKRNSLGHFLTRLCAIIGGVFTVRRGGGD